ncbi:hypothetical protein LguiA_021256 [Lonicera macranthoides]
MPPPPPEPLPSIDSSLISIGSIVHPNLGLSFQLFISFQSVPLSNYFVVSSSHFNRFITRNHHSFIKPISILFFQKNKLCIHSTNSIDLGFVFEIYKQKKGERRERAMKNKKKKM